MQLPGINYIPSFELCNLGVYQLNCRGAQLLEKGCENLDKIHDLREKERSFADELFSQFVVIGGCESLIRDLERVAEEFLTILYPSEDFKVSGKPKFTFSLDEVKIDGSFQYNRETCGVNKNIFNKVMYFNFCS